MKPDVAKKSIIKALNGRERITLKAQEAEIREIKVQNLKKSAVLIPIIDDGNEAKLLFTKRTTVVKNHKGQISFPGGAMEEGETPIDTALREAEEEIGIKPESVEVLGLLDDTISIAGYLITPVVGLTKQTDFNANPYEVDKLLIFPINKIIEAEYLEEDFRWEFHIGGEIIWGATARILKNFLTICFRWKSEKI